MQRSKESLYVWKPLYFFYFSSAARAAGSRCSRPPAPRQPCPRPAAFPGKRGRRGGGQRRIPRKPRFPRAPRLWRCSGSFPARRGGERPSPAGPPGEHLGGRAASIWSGRGESRGAAAGGSCPPPPALPRPTARPPEEGKEGGEGAAREGTAQVRAAPIPGAGRAGVKAGRAGPGMSDIAGGKDSCSMFVSVRSRGTLLRWKSAMALAKVAGAQRGAWPLQASGAFCPVRKRLCSRGSGSLNKGETKCSTEF